MVITLFTTTQTIFAQEYYPGEPAQYKADTVYWIRCLVIDTESGDTIARDDNSITPTQDMKQLLIRGGSLPRVIITTCDSISVASIGDTSYIIKSNDFLDIANHQLFYPAQVQTTIVNNKYYKTFVWEPKTILAGDAGMFQYLIAKNDSVFWMWSGAGYILDVDPVSTSLAPEQTQNLWFTMYTFEDTIVNLNQCFRNTGVMTGQPIEFFLGNPGVSAPHGSKIEITNDSLLTILINEYDQPLGILILYPLFAKNALGVVVAQIQITPRYNPDAYLDDFQYQTIVEAGAPFSVQANYGCQDSVKQEISFEIDQAVDQNSVEITERFYPIILETWNTDSAKMLESGRIWETTKILDAIAPDTIALPSAQTSRSTFKSAKVTDNYTMHFAITAKNPNSGITSPTKTIAITVTGVGGSTGIGKSLIGAQMEIYPNPASDILILKDAPLGETMSIIDITGKVVMQASIQATLLINNISGLSPGVYLVQAGSLPAKQFIIRR